MEQKDALFLLLESTDILLLSTQRAAECSKNFKQVPKSLPGFYPPSEPISLVKEINIILVPIFSLYVNTIAATLLS